MGTSIGRNEMSKNLILILLAVLLFGAFAVFGCTPVPPPNFRLPGGEQTAHGGFGFWRTLSIIGIGAIVFFACWNSMKIYIAAVLGIFTILTLATMCMYYEKWFALIAFIGLGVGLILVLISLFVKHKGI